VIDEELTDEMKITVIATGFDKESAAMVSAAATTVMPASQPRYIPRPADDLPRPMMANPRVDDLDVPTFIRKKAD
jgi:cell division GTPase FtsZ